MSEAALVASRRDGIAGLARDLERGRTSSTALTTAALDRIQRYDSVLNAVVTVLADEALDAARRADREIRDGRSRGPLHGVPIGLKDVIDVRGVRTTMGSESHLDDVATRDAAVVRRLRRAGAVIIGKLNTQEFAYGATGEASFHGPTRNPHDLGRISGGSSGGPAAAVATGMCAGAIGTDTGGSVRIPAALCGVVGLKPTSGRVGRTGVLPLSWTLDHVGPITRSVADNALLLGALCGFDPDDDASVRRSREDFARDLSTGVRRLRVGVPDACYEHLDPEVRQGAGEALRRWEELGVTLMPVEIPELDRIVSAQRTILSAEAYSVHRRRLTERPQVFRPAVRDRLTANATLPAWAYAESHRLRGEAIHALDEALAEVDVLATPTVPIPAPLLGRQEISSTGRPEVVQAALTRLTGVTNLTGHPSLTVPCDRRPGELPVGVQLIGRRWAESMLFRFGRALEDTFPESR